MNKRIFTILVLAAAVMAFAEPSELFDHSQLKGKFNGNGNNSTRATTSNSTSQPPALASKASTASASSKASETDEPKDERAFHWEGTSVDQVLQAYGDETGKTILTDPNVKGDATKITLKSREGQKLSKEEYLEAIEVVLEMNGVHLEPYGENFIRAVPRKSVRKEGVPLFLDTNFSAIPDFYKKEGKVISMMIKFQHIGTEEAQKALEGFKSDSGLLQVFERIGSILITDTFQNIERMSEIAIAIDKPTPVTERTEVFQIKYASANEIKQVLEAIVQDSQKEIEKNKESKNVASNGGSDKAMQVSNYSAIPFKDTKKDEPKPTGNESQVTYNDAERGLIRGRVLIVAEERSNKLVIVTNDDNMKAFEKLIKDLDVETTPDTEVHVYRLKYADAEDVADMINDLIGNASKSSSKGSQNANSKKPTSTKGNATPKKSVNQRSGEARAGELSKDNTTVLADKRINGLVVMTDKDLVKTVESIIESMDVKLSQVLIETVIVEVALGDEIKTGVDWISGLKSGGNQAMASGSSSSSLRTTTTEGSVDVGALVTDAISTVPAAQGIGYFANIKDLDLSLIIQASKTDTRSKYLASPVIMTLDNKEATIDATTKQQFITGWQAVSSSYAGSGLPSPTYSSTDIGLKVKVTPKINPNGTVMLEVEEEYTQVAGQQDMLVPNTTSDSKSSYTTQQVDIPTTRKMTSDVLLENRQTVVFGGLAETLRTETDGGIPILKDIPYIGKWLFGKVNVSDKRTELLVFMTPYVMDSGAAAQNEALRRKQSMSDPNPWDDHGWSASSLADPVSIKEQLRKQKRQWKNQDEEHEAAREMERLKEERVQKLIERAREEKSVNGTIKVSLDETKANVSKESQPAAEPVKSVSPEAEPAEAVVPEAKPAEPQPETEPAAKTEPAAAENSNLLDKVLETK